MRSQKQNGANPRRGHLKSRPAQNEPQATGQHNRRVITSDAGSKAAEEMERLNFQAPVKFA